MMGSAILLYAGFRVFRARKMLQRHKESEKEYLNRLEKDE
jgi:threonine/homoserine/homoserine lactone efflux protein